jgi:hypothetical protein
MKIPFSRRKPKAIQSPSHLFRQGKTKSETDADFVVYCIKRLNIHRRCRLQPDLNSAGS